MPNVYPSERSNATKQVSSASRFVRNLSGSSLALGAIVGLIAGLIIAWAVWPVQWTNAWPGDLSQEAKAQYLASVAQVYTYFNNEQAAEVARGRLLDLNENLGEEIAAAQAYFQDNPQRDGPVYITMLGQLAEGLGVTSPNIITAPTEAAPAAATEDAAPSGGAPSWLIWIGAFLAIVLLVGGGIFVISKLALRRKHVVDSQVDSQFDNVDDDFEDQFGADRYGPEAGPPGRPRSAPAYGPSAAGHAGFNVHAADDYEFESEPDDASLYSRGASIQDLDDEGDFDQGDGEDDLDDDVTQESDEEYFSGGQADRMSGASAAAQAAPASGTGSRQAGARVLDTFIAHYQAGVIDFDQSFKIVDPESNRFVGECGMGVDYKNGILQDDPENVIALDIWLYDQKMEKSVGNRTRVLLSEYALDRNLEPSLMRERPNDPPPIVAQPGISFQIKGPSLTLDCEVIEAEYVKNSRDAGIFQNVKVELTVRSRG